MLTFILAAWPTIVKIRRRGYRPRSGTLEILHDPPNAKFEIVAVHGLGAHPNHTWTQTVLADSTDRPQDPKPAEHVRRHTHTRIHLLRDLLPHDFPEARILSFAHNSNWLTDAPVKTTEEIGKNLLEEIKAKRSHQHLPIIFIGHSLGGIIVKQALCSHGSQEVVNDTSGIIFLGTPHQGSSISAAAAVLAFATSFLGSDMTLLLSLRSHEAQLSNLRRRFQDCISLTTRQHLKIRIISFYETMPMYLLGVLSIGLVVSRDSAVVHADEEFSMETDHSGLNKCTGSDDELFVQLKQAIRSLRAPSLLEQADTYICCQHYSAEKLQIERLSGETLHMDQCYINLALVEKLGDNVGPSLEGSPFSLLARQKVQKPGMTIQVELSKIFNKRKRPDGSTMKPRRILIRGRAGVGKTTLCKKMVYEFTRGTWGEWCKLFHRILWVPLRNLKLQERRQVPGYNHEDLFYHEYFSGEGQDRGRCLAGQLWQALTDTKSSTTLFILDGLDEVSQDLGYADAMSCFLNELLKQPNIIITSRPSAPPPADLDLELETVGFYSDQVKDYIKEAFTDRMTKVTNLKRVDDIQSFLQKHWLIQGLVCIPIQLDALCYTWDDLTPEDVLDTMTGMYRLIELKLWKKDVMRLEKKDNGKLVTPSQVTPSEAERLIQDELCFLEGLAFTGMYNDVIDFTSKNWEFISKEFNPGGILLSKTLPCLSFVRASDPSSKVRHQSYHFIHLTFQEYFAARYFVRQWFNKMPLKCLGLGSGKVDEIKPDRFIQKHKYTLRYDIFWRFVAGLMDADRQARQFMDLIEEEPLDLLGPTHQRLVMHCLSEISDKSNLPIRPHLEARIPNWILFEQDFTGRSLLARDSECPENSIYAVLKIDSNNRRLHILKEIRHRGTPLSEKIVIVITSLFEDKNDHIRCAAADAFDSQSNLSDTAVAALVALLQHKSWTTRRAASHALGRLHLPNRVVKVLLPLLQDKDKDIQHAAVNALARSTLSDTPITANIELLKNKDRDIQLAAANTLSKSNLSDNEITAIKRLLEDKAGSIRRAAADALRRSNLSDKAVTAVTALLKDNDLDIQHAAALALREQWNLSKTAIAALTALLHDKDKSIQHGAAIALSQQSNLPEIAMTALTALLKDKDSGIQFTTSFALQGSNLSDKVTTAIIKLLEDKDEGIRRAATDVLGSKSNLSDTVITTLIALLKDEDRVTQIKAAFALRRQPNLPDTAITLLITLLEDKDSAIRHTAAIPLSCQPNLSDTVIAALITLLEDEDEHVRSIAAVTLASQSNLSDTILAAFIALLKDEEWIVRHRVARYVGDQSKLLNKMLDGLGLSESEQPHKAARSTFLSSLLLESLYGCLLCGSFKEQLSLYVETHGDGRLCIINQPSGLRTAPLEEIIPDGQVSTSLSGIRQRWNDRGYKL